VYADRFSSKLFSAPRAGMCERHGPTSVVAGAGGASAHLGATEACRRSQPSKSASAPRPRAALDTVGGGWPFEYEAARYDEFTPRSTAIGHYPVAVLTISARLWIPDSCVGRMSWREVQARDAAPSGRSGAVVHM